MIKEFTVQFHPHGSAGQDPLSKRWKLQIYGWDENGRELSASLVSDDVVNPPTPERLLNALARIMREGADAERD